MVEDGDWHGEGIVENGHVGSISATPTTALDVWTRRLMFWKE